MSRTRCAVPLELSVLVAYQLGELDEAQQSHVEEHYFGCAECSHRLSFVAELGRGVKRLLREGEISVGATAALVEHASGAGLVLRRYRIEPGCSVACTVAPEDDFVLVQLSANVATDEEADIETQTHVPGTGERTLRVTSGAVVDRAHGEISYLYAGPLVRSFPRSDWTMNVRLRGPRGERQLGPYTMNHTPWDQRSSAGA